MLHVVHTETRVRMRRSFAGCSGCARPRRCNEHTASRRRRRLNSRTHHWQIVNSSSWPRATDGLRGGACLWMWRRGRQTTVTQSVTAGGPRHLGVNVSHWLARSRSELLRPEPRTSTRPSIIIGLHQVRRAERGETTSQLS